MENNYVISNLDDIAGNLINNLSDEDLDLSVRVFNKVCKLLKVTQYSDVWLINTSYEYDIKEYKDYFDSTLITSFPRLSLEVYSFGDNLIIRENIGSIINLYCKSEDIAQEYINAIDKINK